MSDISEMSFETALKELERVIALLEKGDCDLEQAVFYYERGSLLKNFCEQQLNKAKERIEIINSAIASTVDNTTDTDELNLKNAV